MFKIIGLKCEENNYIVLIIYYSFVVDFWILIIFNEINIEIY